MKVWLARKEEWETEDVLGIFETADGAKAAFQEEWSRMTARSPNWHDVEIGWTWSEKQRIWYSGGWTIEEEEVRK